MKTKIIFLLTFLMILVSCTEKHFIVKIPIQVKGTVAFNKFDRIILGGFDIESALKSPDPKIELVDFFTTEYQKVIAHKIEYFEIEENISDRFQALKEKLKNSPNSLLITGKFKIDIKTRSIVKDVKSGSKNTKTFIKIEFWEMLLQVEYIDTGSFQSLEKRTYRENLKDADPEKIEFNFKSLFDKITDRFLRESQKKFKVQERYLLKNRIMP